MIQLQREKAPRGNLVLDWLMAIGAVGSIAALVLCGLPPMHTDTFSGTDFKTLYASAWCFAHRQDAYSFPNLQGVFQLNHVTPPSTWFAHAPVYPAFTLALIAPLTLLPMVPAVWLAAIVFAGLLVGAVFVLLRYAREVYGLPLFLRAVIAGLCAASPLLSFALGVVNVSTGVAALCILACVRNQRKPAWSNAAALALAVLLKPHMAFWVVLALLLLPERPARLLATRAVALAAGFMVATGLVLACSGTLTLQVRSYAAMLHAETAGSSSMSAASHEALPAVAQIPSLQSLIGFWIPDAPLRSTLAVLLLCLIALPLAWYTRRLGRQQDATLAVAAWSAFGLIATYHRAHDGLLLLIVLPWILAQVRAYPLRMTPWVMLGAMALLSCGPQTQTLVAMVLTLPPHSAEAFLLLRQIALAATLFTLAALCAVRSQQALAARSQHARAAD